MGFKIDCGKPIKISIIKENDKYISTIEIYGVQNQFISNSYPEAIAKLVYLISDYYDVLEYDSIRAFRLLGLAIMHDVVEQLKSKKSLYKEIEIIRDD